MGWRPEKAYRNLDFILSKAARTIRILSEYVEPETRFAREGIDKVLCFFGSVRDRRAGKPGTRQSQGESQRARTPGDGRQTISLLRGCKRTRDTAHELGQRGRQG